MKYLNDFDLKASFFSLGNNRQLKYIKESTHILDEERIIEEIPINILSIQEKNHRKCITYNCDLAHEGGIWEFAYKEKTYSDDDELMNFRVSGSALILDQSKMIRFDREFGTIDEAETYYEKMKDKYPESHIIVNEKNEKTIKYYF